MTKRQTQVMQENTKATEAKAREMISAAREKSIGGNDGDGRERLWKDAIRR